ncbi:hypothetical protein D3C85_275110 [compost metagenome]
MLQPGEHRSEKCQTNELSRRVKTNRRGAFPLGKPRRDHTAVDRISRRFQRTDRHAQYKQRDETRSETEHHRSHRPQQQRDAVKNARRHAIDQPAAGDLHRGVSPAERGENQTDVNRIDAQLTGQRRRSNRQVAAVEVVDDHGDKQQHHDEKTLTAGRD